MIDQPRKKAGRKVKVHTPGVFLREFTKPDGTKYKGDIWQICYAVPDQKRPGKTKMKFETSKSKNKSFAEELLIKRKASVLLEMHPEKAPKKSVTFESFVDDYYLEACSQQRSLGEKKRVCGKLKDYFGRWDMTAITARHVENYRQEKRTKASSETANRHLAIIKHIFSIAADQRHKVVNADKKMEIHSVPLDEEVQGRFKYLTKEELKSLLAIAEKRSKHLRDIMEFAATTGLRRGRILDLQWSHIRFDSESLQIPKDKNGDAFSAPLHPVALGILNRRKDMKSEKNPYVFFNPDSDTKWSSISDGARGAFKAIKLNGYRFHDLRHTFISHLVMAGVDIRTVQQLAGHKTLAMTLKYSHLSPEHTTRAINKLSYD